jgi:hypothetical protein
LRSKNKIYNNLFKNKNYLKKNNMKKGSYLGPKVVIIFILFTFLIFYISITPIILKFEESTYFTTWATSIYTLA